MNHSRKRPNAAFLTKVCASSRRRGPERAARALAVALMLATTIVTASPEPGTWRLFLLTYIHGKHLTPTLTLHASS